MLPDYAWLSGPTGQCILDKQEVIIGRDQAADLVVPLRSISRRHARIVQIKRAYYLCDLDSRNGTFLNGRPIGHELQRLKDGDTIVLGGVIEFCFHYPTETEDSPRVGRLTGIWVEEGTHEVWVDGHQVQPPLSMAQFTLLRLLLNAGGRIVSRDEIIAAVWPQADPGGVSDEAVDALVKRLRARLRATSADHEYIRFVRGHGVKLEQPQIRPPTAER